MQTFRIDRWIWDLIWGHGKLEEITMHLDGDFVHDWARRYVDEELGAQEVELLGATHTAVAARGYLTGAELVKIVRWKSRRALGHLRWRDDETIRDVTSVAFASATPCWMRHHVLDILPGVDHPVAGAVLTVWNTENYTMYDYRAIEALGELRRRDELDPNQSPGRYWAHLQVCRDIAKRLDVGLRDLDRALWKWHREESGTWPTPAPKSDGVGPGGRDQS
jgi:hypothetical protein